MQDKSAKLFSKYIETRRILIADTAAASRAGLAKTMNNMGAKTTNIRMAPKYENALHEIETFKPHVVITDFNLGKRSGLDLLQEQRKDQSEEDRKTSLFILVTGNTSQSAVAQAAEEDVDTYVLKPYTIDVLRSSIMRAALQKIYPSDYQKKVDEGKKVLFDGDPTAAMKLFEEAMGMHPKPALACFYHGQAQLIKKAIEEAKGDYEKGLNFNKIHYKCLTGLFETLMEKKAYKEAYDVIKKVSRYFPANPQRLTTVLRLAVMTQSYEDVERYYQVFTNIDQRNEELIKYICAALVVCGRFYLQGKHASRALSLFQKAAVTASGRVKILREIIMALAAHEMHKEAEGFLKRFPPDTQGGPDYKAMEYLVAEKFVSASVTVEKGRKLLQDGIEDPLIYKILISKSAESGLKESAEELCGKASGKWPNQAESFKEAIQQGLERKAAAA